MKTFKQRLLAAGKNPNLLLLMGLPLLFSCHIRKAEDYVTQAKSEIDGKKKIELLTKAIELKPDYLEALFERACANSTAAISLRRDLIPGKMAPKGEDYKYYDSCLNDFKRVLKIDSNYALAYFQRGCIEHWFGDSLKACDDLHKSASLGYDCSDAIKDFCK